MDKNNHEEFEFLKVRMKDLEDKFSRVEDFISSKAELMNDQKRFLEKEEHILQKFLSSLKGNKESSNQSDIHSYNTDDSNIASSLQSEVESPDSPVQYSSVIIIEGNQLEECEDYDAEPMTRRRIHCQREETVTTEDSLIPIQTTFNPSIENLNVMQNKKISCQPRFSKRTRKRPLRYEHDRGIKLAKFVLKSSKHNDSNEVEELFHANISETETNRAANLPATEHFIADENDCTNDLEGLVKVEEMEFIPLQCGIDITDSYQLRLRNEDSSIVVEDILSDSEHSDSESLAEGSEVSAPVPESEIIEKEGDISNKVIDDQFEIPPLEINREIQPLEMNKEIQPLEMNREIQPLEMNREIPTLEMIREIPPLELNRKIPILKMNTEIPPLEINRVIPPLEINRVIPPLEINIEIPPLEMNIEVPPLKIKKRSRIRKGIPDKTPQTCSICGKTLRSVHGLVSHMHSHTGNKPFECNKCNVRFAQKSSLSRHLLRHTGEKRFTCDACDKAFINRYDLVIHSRTHSRRAQTCSKCSKDFFDRRYYKSHVKICSSDNNDKSKCPKCKKHFKDPRYVPKHIQSCVK